MNSFRLLVADDQTLLRQDLVTLLGLREGVTVAGTPASVEAACELVERFRPEVALINTTRLDRLEGWQLLRDVKQRQPQTVVIVLTSGSEDGGAVGALRSGADGCLLLNQVTDRLIVALSEMKPAGVALPTGGAAHLAARLLDQTLTAWRADHEAIGGESPPFSRRECEIIELLLQGLSNRSIAQRLFMSEGTIKNYLCGIYAKVGVHDRAQAVISLQKINQFRVAGSTWTHATE